MFIDTDRKLRLLQRATLAACVALMSMATLAAEPQPSETGAQAAPLVISAARIFDGVSGTLLTGATVVVQDGRIVSVGADAKIPAGAQVIDMGDATLLPGFIDAHTHLSWEFPPNYYLGFHQRLSRFPAEQAHYAAAFARRNLE